MKDLAIGVQIRLNAAEVLAAIDSIVQAEEIGLDAVWLNCGVTSIDPMAVLPLVATRTSRIRLGTAIVPILPRHPLALAQSSKVVAELAPGRFRLGVGPSHRALMEGAGIPFSKPHGHLREYLRVLKASLQQGGKIDFQGEFYRAKGDWGHPVSISVMASGLRWKAFSLIGELADGGISWLCPLDHIQRVALPAMAEGAAKAGRGRPKMVMHVPICVHNNRAEVHEAAARELAMYPRLEYYAAMLAEAGFPEAAQGILSERMIDALVAYGDESAVGDRLRAIAATGVDEVVCSIITVGRDQNVSRQRTLQLLGRLCASA